MDAGKRIVTDIFNRARTLEIPFFQRGYVWGTDNWDRFLDDVVRVADQQRPYFMGSIIQKQRATSSERALGDVRLVVDGQQRLTTLVLFFRVLYEARGDTDTFDQVFRTFGGDHILKHNHADIVPFEAALEGQLTPEIREAYAKNRVLGAYDYFERNKKRFEHINPHVLYSLLHFVGVDLGAEEDEQQIFDTINSLGVALSTAELLKNELFQRTDIALYRDTWQKVFEPDEATRDYWGRRITAGRTPRETIDLFLQAFLTMSKGSAENVRVDALFQAYKKIVAERVADKTRFVHELTECATLFQHHVRFEQLNEELDPSSAMDRLNVVLFGLNTTTALPYVLYVLRNVSDISERDRILWFIETYLIRRLVCRETGKAYNRLFAGFIRGGIDTREALMARVSDPNDASVRLPSDSAFEAGFLNSNLTNQQARVVLYLLEASVRDNRLHSTALSGLSHYSLEHLMPKKWRNHWGPIGDVAARERDQALRKLGNLSLLSSTLNTAIRDSNWERKRNGTEKRHGLKKYAAGLETLGADLKLDEWNEATIRARGVRLAKHALQVWPSQSGS